MPRVNRNRFLRKVEVKPRTRLGNRVPARSSESAPTASADPEVIGWCPICKARSAGLGLRNRYRDGWCHWCKTARDMVGGNVAVAERLLESLKADA